MTGHICTLRSRSGDRTVPRALRALDDAGVDVLNVEVRRPTLDDVFLTLTGKHAAAADGPDSEDAA